MGARGLPTRSLAQQHVARISQAAARLLNQRRAEAWLKPQRSRQARNCWPIVGRSAVIGVSNPRPLARQTSSVRELGAAYLHVIDKAL
jgi:hypothetical protein